MTNNRSRTTAWIDRKALRQNVAVARGFCGSSRLCAVVKADAYGHGTDIVVPTLASHVDCFAVATVEEGISVRKLVRDHDIIVLSGFNHPSQLPSLNTYRLQPVIHQSDQIGWLRNHGGAEAGCWLKVDTGMHRLGFDPDEVEQAFDLLRTCSGREPGLMSHFAVADEPDHPKNAEQLNRFHQLAHQFDVSCSMANSAALTEFSDSRLDMVRVGLLLYGISPQVGKPQGHLDVQPVMQFEGRVIAVKQLLPGETVGYGATWQCRLPRTLAIAGAGYADGYPRIIGNRGYALVDGRRAPVVGRVSMDTMALDVTECDPVAVGNPIELWGKSLNAATVSDWADTIAYELLCRVSPRVPRLPLD